MDTIVGLFRHYYRSLLILVACRKYQGQDMISEDAWMVAGGGEEEVTTDGPCGR